MEKRKLKKPIKALLAVFVCLVGLLGAVGINRAVSAYLSDKSDIGNVLELGEVDGEIIEEFTPPAIDVGTNIYAKKVSIKNVGTVPMYTRVSLKFSNSEMEAISTVTTDGTNWYPLSELKDHLNDGWIYNEDDGFYYYTKILKENEISTPLIEQVKTEVKKQAHLQPYEIFVNAQYTGASKRGLSLTEENTYSYTQAWEVYARDIR